MRTWTSQMVFIVIEKHISVELIAHRYHTARSYITFLRTSKNNTTQKRFKCKLRMLRKSVADVMYHVSCDEHF